MSGTVPPSGLGDSGRPVSGRPDSGRPDSGTPIPGTPIPGTHIPGGWRGALAQVRPQRWVFAIGLLLALAILGGTAILVWSSRAREIRNTEQDLRNLDLLLAEQTVRALQGVDLVLDGVISELRLEHITDPATLSSRKSGQDTEQELRRKVAALPQLQAVLLIAADGTLVNSSDRFAMSAVNVADHDYFRTLRDAPPGSDLFLSLPMENPATGSQTIYLARRINGPDGSFLGVVVGAIQLDYFRSLYAGVSETTAISLWRGDGSLLVRFPPPAPDDHEAQRIPPGLLGAIHRGTPIALRTPHGDHSGERLVATMMLVGYPVIASVTMAEADALANWANDSVVVVGAGLVCAAMVGLLTLLLLRQTASYEATRFALLAREDAVRAREQAEAQLRQAQKMEAIGQLTAGLAHDFNNLLTSITGNLERLEQGSGPSASARALELIRQAADRGAGLTRQLLAFSRQQILQPRAIALGQVLLTMQELLRGTLGGTITLELHIQPDLWPAFADPTQIGHVVLNLAINGRDAMAAGGTLVIEAVNAPRDGDPASDDPARARPAELPSGDYVLIGVRDSGIGMSAEVLARAFDPFFTTKPPGKGTGLGLSQVYGFARQSGGSVLIESSEGVGTRVTVFLPRSTVPLNRPALAEAPVAEAPVTEASGTGASGTDASGTEAPTDVIGPVARAPAKPTDRQLDLARICVLVVDDDPLVRETVAGSVTSLGCQTVSEADGAAALRRLASDHAMIDLVLLDYAMPGMTGVEVARQIRAAWPLLPIMFMTGYADPEPLRAERWILHKPFRNAHLAAMLVEALDEQTVESYL